jgi:hypothetical protein
MMKKIEPELKSANWENRLLNDLAFIKKHGRYPLNKRTLAPSFAMFFLVALLARFCVPLLLMRKANHITMYIVVLITLIGIIASLYRYYSTIRFKRITTKFFLTENQKLLQKFLESQHLAYTHHPNAPEIFMILSKNLSLRGDEREIMIFITDDKQILVNSHFTGNKFTINPPSKQYKEMANMLQRWINTYINNSNTTIFTTN